ncbi:hypothetical protein JTB14_011694 [Gonioctena quinquepunctata]|nr:hypothetical protein JTB14_011694 [Gonioctena quinquepunctata]
MRKPDKKAMPMVLVTCNRNQKEIFDVFEMLSIRVVAEFQKPRTSVGHAQKNCWASPVCVKRAGNHESKECKKPKKTPATCANCKCGYTASYRGYNCFPKLGRINKNRINSEQVPVSSPRPRPSGAYSQRSVVSYAQAAATVSDDPFSKFTASIRAFQD